MNNHTDNEQCVRYGSENGATNGTAFVVLVEDLLDLANSGRGVITRFLVCSTWNGAMDKARQMATEYAKTPGRRFVEFPFEARPMKSFQVEQLAAPFRYNPILRISVNEVTVL